MSKSDRYITPKERWLRERGGRTYADLERDKTGEYIEMGSGEFNKILKVYLPSFDLSTPPVNKSRKSGDKKEKR